MEFKQLEMNDVFIQALKKQKITKPTAVQANVYKDIIDHKDLIVQSETGSGKTLAYLLPIFEKYKVLERTSKVIILVPTQELAMQVHRQVQTLAENSGIALKSVPVFGSVKIERQMERLKSKPQIVIGTSARILELIKAKKIAAHTVKTIVLDEADKLLDKKNLEGTKAVIKCTMKDRQLLFFSASTSPRTTELAKELSKDAKVIQTEDKRKIPSKIQHMYVVTDSRNKIDTLRKLVRAQKGKKMMIFINGTFEIEEATQKLQYHGYKAACIHGSVNKQARQAAIEDFKKDKITCLIATDIAARGLHFEGVDTIFHLSIPEDPTDYLHRAGRTGRNGTAGTSISIVTEEEVKRIKSFQKACGINILAKKLYQGKIVRV